MLDWWNQLSDFEKYAIVNAVLLVTLWLRTGSQQSDIESVERRVRDLERRP